MALDLRTIFVVASLTLIALGLLNLVAYSAGRFSRWPLWWSAGNVLVGAGTLGAALRDFAPPLLTVGVASSMILAGYVLMLAAVRIFAGRPAKPRLLTLVVVFGAFVYCFVLDAPENTIGRIVFNSVLLGLIDLAVLREAVALARHQRLRSAWFFAALYATSAAIFAVRAGVALGAFETASSLFDGDAGLQAWLVLFTVTTIVMRSLAMLVMASERSHNELAELAHHDPLTGVLNRAGLSRALSLRPIGVASVLLIDIDHFKALNDRHGHLSGDGVLRLLAAIAGRELAEGDLLVRQGGDEFVAVLPERSATEGRAIAERIRKAFRAAIEARGDLAVRPTLSIGVAACAIGCSSLDILFERADKALYHSKRGGRNRVAAHGEGAVAA